MNIPAGEFKARCLKIMDDVKKNRQEVIITKHGKPIAKLVPIDNEVKVPIYGCLAESVQIYGDVFSTGESWESND